MQAGAGPDWGSIFGPGAVGGTGNVNPWVDALSAAAGSPSAIFGAIAGVFGGFGGVGGP
jgi:hypothetical protein